MSVVVLFIKRDESLFRDNQELNRNSTADERRDPSVTITSETAPAVPVAMILIYQLRSSTGSGRIVCLGNSSQLVSVEKN
jgi:hypothetical protein